MPRSRHERILAYPRCCLPSARGIWRTMIFFSTIIMRNHLSAQRTPLAPRVCPSRLLPRYSILRMDSLVTYAPEKIASRAIDPLKVNIMCAEQSEDCPSALLLMGHRHKCRNNALISTWLARFPCEDKKKSLRSAYTFMYTSFCQACYVLLRQASTCKFTSRKIGGGSK